MLDSADGLVLPFELFWARPIYHLYVIRTRDRQQLRDHLAAAGIGTGIHYPIPLHLQKAYVALGYREGNFPVLKKSLHRSSPCRCTPISGHAEQKYVVDTVLAWLDLQRSAPVELAQEESAA